MFWIGLGVWVVIKLNVKINNGKLMRRLGRDYPDTPSPAARVLPLGRGRAYITRRAVLAIVLMVFGVSDFVEMTIGAWWTPCWLLVWKLVCVSVLIYFFIHLVAERRRQWEHT